MWWYINQAFAEPATRSDDSADYAPTQVLAEWFRLHGFDGLIYGSSMGKGSNVAVFDLSCAELAMCYLYEAKAVQMNFQFASNPYHVPEYENTIRFDVQDAE